jgi:hypothetical protein
MRLHLLALPILLGGCGVPLLQQDPEIDNSCSSDSDCGSNGVCIEQTCISTTADLGNLLIQIDVPDGASYGEGTAQVVFPGDDNVKLSGQLSGGYNLGYQLETATLVEIVMTVTADAIPQTCVDTEAIIEDENEASTIPFVLELVPKIVNDGITLQGIPLPTYSAKRDPAATDNVLTLLAPAGLYDLYITPDFPVPDDLEPGAIPDCVMAPTVVLDVDTSENFPSLIHNSEPYLIIPEVVGLDVAGWTAELLENKNGRVISTRAFQEQTMAGTFHLRTYVKIDDEELAVLRLTPPGDLATTGTPTILAKVGPLFAKIEGLVVEFSALDLSALGEDFATPISVSGDVFSTDTNDPIPSSLVIQSLQLLDGKLNNGVSTYRTTKTTGADGHFSDVMLIPGTYAVIASPNGSQGYAVTRGEIDLSEGDAGGKSVFVKPKRRLLGVAKTPTEGKAFQVQVLLSPSAASETTFITSLLDTTAQPTPVSAFTNDNGQFELDVDPGTYNLVLLPPASSELPWAVLSRLGILDVDDQPLQELTMALSNPVVFHGMVRAPNDEVVGNALIRAFVRPEALDEMDNPPVIQIGETTSDANGRYELLLPASVVASVSQ